jgi:hypothetical protein
MQCRVVDQGPETTVQRVWILVQIELKEHPEQVFDEHVYCLWGVLPVDEGFVNMDEDQQLAIFVAPELLALGAIWYPAEDTM